MSDVLDHYPPGDIEDGGGNAESDLLAEHKLVGALLRQPEISVDIRDLVSPELFFDRALGRLFGGIASLDGFAPDSDQLVTWLGGDSVEIAGRSGKQALGYLISVGDEVTPDEATVLADHIFELGERRLTAQGQVFQSKMGLVTWADRNSVADDVYDEYIEGIIPERELVLVIGATQAGKSFLTRHMCYCLARGIEFMGHRILEPVPVVWCAYEGGRGVKARDQAYDKHYGYEGEMPLATLAKPIDLWSKDLNVEELITEIEGVCRAEFNGRPPGVIVVDTHNAATPGASEIDSEAISKINVRYKRLRDVFGCTVIVVGHTNALGKMRGNEQLANNIETVITVTKKTVLKSRVPEQVKDDDGREVRSVDLWKQREGATGHLFDFVLPAIETKIKNKFGKFRTSCVVTTPNWSAQAEAEANVKEKKSDTKAGFKLTGHEDHFFSVLWKALERGAPAPPELGLASNVRVAHRSEVIKLYKATFIPKDGSEVAPDNTINSRWTRATGNLRKFKVIGYQNNLFWWTGKPILGKPETFQQRMLFDERDMPPDDEFPPDQ